MEERIIIPRDWIYIRYTFEGKEHEDFENEPAIAQLLLDEVIFTNGSQWCLKSEEDTVCCFVNCNDVFAWGCSDSERVSTHEVRSLYEMHMADPKWGSAKWCILKRNEMPQKPVVDAMKKDGSWDLDEAKLGENVTDDWVKAQLSCLLAKQKAAES